MYKLLEPTSRHTTLTQHWFNVDDVESTLIQRRVPAGQFKMRGTIEVVDRGYGPSLENYKALRFVSNTGLDTLENHKAIKPVFNVGQSSARKWNAI